MRALLRLVLAAVAVIVPLAHQPGTASAADRRFSAFVLDANSGQMLHNEQAEEQRYPASLTKMMTLYLVFEAIEAGRLSYATRIKVSQEAASQPPTKLDLDPGETIQVLDAAKALITKSANDMAVALAEHLGGTESRFAQMMTNKARLMGMSQTTFRNASGLPDPGQVTTARDMATLALRLQDDYPKHYTLFALRSFSYGGSTYRNHNNLLFNFQGTEGIKTGYTRASGFNLVAAVRRGTRHVIGVVLGGATASRRDDAMRLLLSRALNKADPVKTRKPAPVLVATARPAPKPAAAPAPRTVAAATAVEMARAPNVPHPQPAVRPQSAPPAPASTQAHAQPAQVPPANANPPRSAAQPLPTHAPAAVPPAAPAAAAAHGNSGTGSGATPDATPQSPPGRIEVARVRPVMVPLRSRTADANAATAPPQVAAATSAIVAAAPSAMVAAAPSAMVAAAPATVPPAVMVPPAVAQRVTVAAAPAAPPPQQPAASHPAPPSVKAASAPAMTTPFAAPSPQQRGNAPSTLDRQAQSLSRGEPPAQPASIKLADATGQPQFRLRGPTPPPGPQSATPPAATQPNGSIASSGFEIQIGAYGTQVEADKALAAARASASDLLQARTARAMLVQKDARQLYRARFTGFDSRAAANTCLELRRRQIDCFVMKTE